MQDYRTQPAPLGTKYEPWDILPNGAKVLATVDNARGFWVMAYWEAREEYVTWLVGNDGGTHSGHYFQGETDARRDLYKRAG